MMIRSISTIILATLSIVGRRCQEHVFYVTTAGQMSFRLSIIDDLAMTSVSSYDQVADDIVYNKMFKLTMRTHNRLCVEWTQPNLVLN